VRSKLFVLSILLCACSQGDPQPANLGDCPPICEGGTTDAKSFADVAPKDSSSEATSPVDAGVDADATTDATTDASADASDAGLLDVDVDALIDGALLDSGAGD